MDRTKPQQYTTKPEPSIGLLEYILDSNKHQNIHLFFKEDVVDIWRISGQFPQKYNWIGRKIYNDYDKPL